MKLFILLLFIITVQSCAVYPKSKYDVDDQRCELRSNKLTLGVMKSKSTCKGSGTAGSALCLIAASTIGVVTAVVSGSIVLVGNTVHWLEKQGKCEDGFLNRKTKNHNEPLLEKEGVLIGDSSEEKGQLLNHSLAY